MTDEPETILYTSVGGRQKLTRAYGSLRRKTGVGPRVDFDAGGPDSLPSELEQLFRTAISFSHKEASDWIPKYLEVLVSQPLPPDWPADWPDLHHRLTWDRGSGYSVYLPGDKLGAVQRYLRGKAQWGLTYRYVFPNEGRWQHAGNSEQELGRLTARCSRRPPVGHGAPAAERGR